MRVYVSGPISKGDQLLNIRAAILARDRLRDAGHAVFCPHLNALAHLVAPRAYEDYIAEDLIWVGQCEAIIRLPGDSPGADREVAEARRLGMPVYEGVTAFLEAEAARQAELDARKTRDEANGALIAAVRNGLPRILALVKAQDAALSVIADRGCRCDVEAEIDPARICCACIAREALGTPAPDATGEAGEARAEGEAR